MILLYTIWSFLLLPQSETFTILMEGFDNNQGKVMLRVRNADGKLLYEESKNITKKKVSILLPLGTSSRIAVEAFHDKNNNDELDKNFLGVPIEEWGVSSSYRPTLKAPELKDILVPVKKGSLVKVHLD